MVDSIFIDDKLDNIIDKQYELYEWYTVNKDGALYLLMSYYKDILNNYNQIIYLEETNIEKQRTIKSFKK